MDTQSLELIYRTACDFYEELELKQKTNNIICYTVYANDLNDDEEFFINKGISISLCYNKEFNFFYVECFHIKHQINTATFDALKKHFIDRYLEILNKNNKQSNSKLDVLFNKMKERRDKQRVAILSEIIDIDVENIDNAQALIQRMVQRSINDRIIIH